MMIMRLMDMLDRRALFTCVWCAVGCVFGGRSPGVKPVFKRDSILALNVSLGIQAAYPFPLCEGKVG